MCSSRLVEPPKAACTTIALRIAASVRMSRDASACARASCSTARARLRAPCRARSAGPMARAPSAAASGPALRRRLATWPPCRGTGSRRPAMAQARQPSSAASSSVISPWAKRAPIDWTLPGVLARRSAAASRRRARGRRADRARRPAPSSSPAGPCRRWPRRARPCACGSERISRRSTMRRVVAIRQAVEHAGRALRAAVARIGDIRRRTASRRSASQLLGRGLAPAGRLPSARCDSPARSAVPSGARSPPCVLRIRNCLRPSSSAGSQPMPAFCVQPNRSPLALSRSISSVSGRCRPGQAHGW